MATARGPLVLPGDSGTPVNEYAPMTGDATTPEVVDGAWWLGLPRAQAVFELGIRDGEYERVARDVAAMAALVANRRAQTGLAIPFVLKRRRNPHNALLFEGGTIRRIGPGR